MSLWFSIYDEKEYKGVEKSFYNSKDYEWAKMILSNKEIIIDELYECIKSQNLFNPYFNQTLTSVDGHWKTIGLKFWSINNYKSQKYFPKTTGLINGVPELVSASFNKLEPGTEILPHFGDTNGIFRCHLGVEIPSGLPECGFEVNGEQKMWSDNELLIFCDAHYHKAWNNTKKDRYIFLFDIIREEYKPLRYEIISTVLSSLFLQKMVLLFGLKIGGSFKRKRLKPIVFVFKPLARFAVWVVNLFKVY